MTAAAAAAAAVAAAADEDVDDDDAAAAPVDVFRLARVIDDRLLKVKRGVVSIKFKG